MAFSARHVSPHDARSPQTGTVLIHWLGSLRAAADSKAHLPPFSPGPWCAIRFYFCIVKAQQRERENGSGERKKKRGVRMSCICKTPDRDAWICLLVFPIGIPSVRFLRIRIGQSFSKLLPKKKSGYAAMGADDREATSKWFISVFSCAQIWTSPE